MPDYKSYQMYITSEGVFLVDFCTAVLYPNRTPSMRLSKLSCSFFTSFRRAHWMVWLNYSTNHWYFLGVVGGTKIQGRGGRSTLALVRQRQYIYIYCRGCKAVDWHILEFRTSEDHICWLFRHHTASIGAVLPPLGGGQMPPYFSVKRQWISLIRIHLYYIGAAYFSPPDF